MPVNPINYGAMFVTPDAKRAGAFNANIPITYGGAVKTKTKYFGTRNFTHPKISAARYVEKVLEQEYGKERAPYIGTIPQFIHRMKLGCMVRVATGYATSRNKKYPVVICNWTEFRKDGRRYKSHRCNKRWAYNDTNQLEIEHKANLFAARKRAELTHSNLDEQATNFEFDLDYIREQ